MFTISFSHKHIILLKHIVQKLNWLHLVVFIAVVLACTASLFFLLHHEIIAYGDSESHLNISKRVIDSITPGMAQLGGIWLPLPSLMMVPFVKFEFLYRTGLAGSIVSGAAFIISSIFIYKIAYFLTKNSFASFVSFVIFAVNPNMLYLQSTPLTEPVLIMFFILSSYYFIHYIFFALRDKTEMTGRQREKEYLFLITASFFAFCASLSRYDGWFLVLVEISVVIFLYIPVKKILSEIKHQKLRVIPALFRHKFYMSRATYRKMEAYLVVFAVLAFLGIFLWFLWDYLILGDPFYFSDSQYSAKAQQLEWLKRGELPAYRNIFAAFAYYFFDSMSNTGMLVFFVGLVGFFTVLWKKREKGYYLAALILVVPFIFNVISLFAGQSIIFIPHLTPPNFEWHLFNARYGILMMPAVSIFFGMLFNSIRPAYKTLILSLFVMQLGFFYVGYSQPLILADGTSGLSSGLKKPDVERFMLQHYDHGMVLLDDYARSMSIIRSDIPMQKIIYVGNKPYWDRSLKTPERYATWVVMQKNDAVWNGIYLNPPVLARLYKYFKKVYTSPDTLIFERDDNVPIAINSNTEDNL